MTLKNNYVCVLCATKRSYHILFLFIYQLAVLVSKKGFQRVFII